MSIEHIYEIKEWMETIPMLVRGLDENTKRYVLVCTNYLFRVLAHFFKMKITFSQEYDVLDYFWYNLTDEDFENKWLAIGWPLKIFKHVDLTNEFLIEETDKYYKIQMSDELVLEEKIEALTVQVTNMSAIRDFSRVRLFTSFFLNSVNLRSTEAN